jgi:hypothetical protein
MQKTKLPAILKHFRKMGWEARVEKIPGGIDIAILFPTGMTAQTAVEAIARRV